MRFQRNALLRRRVKPSRSKTTERVVRTAATALIALVVTSNLDRASAQNDDALTDISSNTNDSLSDSAYSLWSASVASKASNGIHTLSTPTEAWNPNPLKTGEANLYFVFDAPTTWNSNPTAVGSGLKSSFRFDPKIQMNTAYQSSVLQVSLQATSDFDRYFANAAANTDGVVSLLKLSLKCASKSTANMCQKGSWLGSSAVPYLSFQSTLKFAEGFGPLKTNQSDLGMGISFNSSFFHVAKPEVTDKDRFPYPQVGLQFETTRRFSNVGADSVSIYLKSSITENFSENFALSFQPSFRVRLFDALAGVTRQDKTLTLPAVIAWDPDIPVLQQLHPEFRVSMNFARTWSNVPSKEFEQWDIGPLVELVYVPPFGD